VRVIKAQVGRVKQKVIYMYRFLFRFSVIIVTILTASLVTGAISDYLVTFRDKYNPLKFTLIGMAIIVVIFYPLFIKLEGWIKKLSSRVMRSGNSFAGKYLGLPLMFIAAFLILFHFYTRMWYGISFFRIATDSIRGYITSLF
jgi:hypothetical protein